MFVEIRTDLARMVKLLQNFSRLCLICELLVKICEFSPNLSQGKGVPSSNRFVQIRQVGFKFFQNFPNFLRLGKVFQVF